MAARDASSMREFPYISGEWLACCDRCARKFYASELRADGEKTGLKVCPDCWDSRHPQREVHAFPNIQSVPWARPERSDVFHFEDEDDYDSRQTAENYPKGF